MPAKEAARLIVAVVIFVAVFWAVSHVSVFLALIVAGFLFVRVAYPEMVMLIATIIGYVLMAGIGLVVTLVGVVIAMAISTASRPPDFNA